MRVLSNFYGDFEVESKSMEDLQDIQKLIFIHRKDCFAIPNFFYKHFKDNDEDKAHRAASMH